MAIALPFIGAAIGSTIGGTFLGISAASLGFMGGQLLGTFFQKGQNVEGPRATDLSAQYSTYGTAIPRHYGANRFAGTVIFCTKKREVAKTEEVGGKGAPSSQLTTYTYNGDIAIGLVDCRFSGPIQGIRKVWINGKLKVDNSDSATIEALAGRNVGALGFKLYTGTTDQLPDPTIEATKGVGNVPGYRGLAYVVLDHANCPNGQYAQYAFEVVLAGGDTIIVRTAQSPNTVANFGYPSSAYIDGDFQMSYPRTVSGVGVGFRADNWLRLGTSGHSCDGLSMKTGLFTGGGTGDNLMGNSDEPGVCFRWRNTGGGEGNIVFQRPDNSIEVYARTWGFSYNTGYFMWAHMAGRFIILQSTGNLAHVFGAGTGYADWSPWSSNPPGSAAIGSITPPGVVESCWATDDAVYLAGSAHGGGSLLWIAKYNRDSLALLDTVTWTAGSGKPSYSRFAIQVISPDEFILGSRDDTKVFRFDVSAGTFDLLWDGFTAIGGFAIYALRLSESILVIGKPGANVGTTTDNLYFVNLDALTVIEYPVADIIEAEAQLSGLTLDKIDVSSITDTVPGYTIGRTTSPRSIIEPLLSGFQIDTFESGGVRKFVKRRDQIVVASIPFEDLGATEGGADAVDPFPLEHSNSLELPRRVTVNYINRDADYQQGSESAGREVVHSNYDLVIDLPYACTPAHAATVAQITLFNAWAERNTRKTSLTRKYAWLDTSDHVLVQSREGGEFTRWVVQKLNDTGYLLELDLTPADMTIYSGQGVGASLGTGQTIEPPVYAARFTVLDGPILRDDDDNAGVYVPVSGGSTGTFPGATISVGQDASNLEQRASVNSEAYIGFAENALAAWSQPYTDETNLLTVQMRSDVILNNSTRDGMLDNGENAIALGVHGRWEILQFIRATSLGGGRFTLSGLHRGQRGTEQYRGAHAAGDTVILLKPAGIGRPKFDVSELNQNRAFKVTAYGRDPDKDGITTAVNTGVGLKPYAPVDLRSSRSSNDITVTWNRQSRLSGQALLGVLPLGEVAERYEMVVYTNNSYVTERRSIFVTAETATYTSAMQTADGATPGATAYVRVFQISDKVGRGYPLQGPV